MRSATYYSQEADSYQAGQLAAGEVLQQWGDGQPGLLLLFASVGHDLGRVLAGVRAVAGPSIPLTGCSGSGIISSQGSDEATRSIGLMALGGDQVHFSPFLFTGLEDNPEGIGAGIAEQVLQVASQQDENMLLLLFADGLTINADKLYRGLNGNLPRHVDIVGGTAGNDFQQQKTFQFSNDLVVSDGVCGALLHGNFRHRIGVTHGSRPVGLLRTITRSEGSVIGEIDHIPALDVLRQHIGVERVQDIGQTLNLFELGEEFPGQGYSENILSRAIIGIDEEQRTIRLAVEIAEGTKVRITRRDRELVLSRTRGMTENITRELHDWRCATYLYFNCSGRGSYLFGGPEPDVDMVREVLTPESTMIGFFTFGEFAPINACNYYHNYTGVLVGLE